MNETALEETLRGITAIAAPLIVAVLGMIVLILDLGHGPEAINRRRFLPTISIVGLVMAAVAAFGSSSSGATDVYQLMAQSGQQTISYFGHGMVADKFGTLFSVALCIVAALAIGMSDRYLEERGLNHGEFYALMLFSTAGGMIMAQASDLVNVFLGLEVLSVSLYILSGFARRDRRSEESAVKYFLLGGIRLRLFAVWYGSCLRCGRACD